MNFTILPEHVVYLAFIATAVISGALGWMLRGQKNQHLIAMLLVVLKEVAAYKGFDSEELATLVAPKIKALDEVKA